MEELASTELIVVKYTGSRSTQVNELFWSIKRGEVSAGKVTPSYHILYSLLCALCSLSGNSQMHALLFFWVAFFG